jgi:hypothetical protein
MAKPDSPPGQNKPPKPEEPPPVEVPPPVETPPPVEEVPPVTPPPVEVPPPIATPTDDLVHLDRPYSAIVTQPCPTCGVPIFYVSGFQWPMQFSSVENTLPVYEHHHP